MGDYKERIYGKGSLQMKEMKDQNMRNGKQRTETKHFQNIFYEMTNCQKNI